MQKEYARTCIICGVHSKDKKFDLPGIVFNYLKDAPTICEQCVFKILTNKSIDWIETIKKFITKEK